MRGHIFSIIYISKRAQCQSSLEKNNTSPSTIKLSFLLLSSKSIMNSRKIQALMVKVSIPFLLLVDWKTSKDKTTAICSHLVMELEESKAELTSLEEKCQLLLKALTFKVAMETITLLYLNQDLLMVRKNFIFK